MTDDSKVAFFGRLQAVVCVALYISFSHSATAQLYWDANGRSNGASTNGLATGTWGVDNFWSTSPSGNRNTGSWTSGQQAIFSAGNDATGAYTVTVVGNQVVSGIVFEEGTLTLTGGTLTLGSGVGNATIEVTSTNFATIISQLAGINGLTKTGSGTLLLAGTNTYSGITDLQEGTLLISKPAALGSSFLEFDGGVFGGVGGPLIINNDLILNSDSTIAGSADLTFTGNLYLQGGPRTLTFLNPGQTIFAGPNLFLGDQNKQGTFTLDVSGGTVSIFSVIQNGVGARADSMIKEGSGTLILTGNNTFTGPLQLNAGTLILGNDFAAGLGALVLGDGVTIGATNGPRTIANSLTIAGNITFAGPDSLTFLDSFNLGGHRTFTVLNTTTFEGRISGGGTSSLTKNGPGTLVLAGSGNNTFGGGLTVNAGTLLLGKDSAAGNGTLTLGNGVTVGAVNGARTIANSLTIAGNVTFTGPDNLTFQSSFDLGGNRTFTVLNTTTFEGIISGANRSLTKNGVGTLVLGGYSANTFSGGLTLNAGTVTAAKIDALGSGPLTLNAGTLNLDAYNQTVGTLTLAGATINGTSGTLTASSFQMQSGTVNASLAGAGALTKSTSGTVTLSAASSYTGGTTINAGTLRINNASGSATGSGTVTVNNGGFLSGAGTIYGPVVVNNGGTIAPGDPIGTLTTGSQTWNGGAHLTVQVSDATAGAGQGWDLLNINGSLNIRASAGNPLFVDLQSLGPGNIAGPVVNFDSSMAFSWRILSATDGINLNPGQNLADVVQVNLGGFANDLANGLFSFSLANGDRDLVLSFTPAQVPEPKTWSMVALGFVLLVARRRILDHQGN
jgi:fibronectin-binding autotransporter adhesin